MISKQTIMDAYLFLRKNNNSIPDETLDFIKDVSLTAYENTFLLGSCSNCKFEKWLNDYDGSVCKFHKHQLNDMFNDELTLDEIGCRQFKQK